MVYRWSSRTARDYIEKPCLKAYKKKKKKKEKKEILTCSFDYQRNR